MATSHFPPTCPTTAILPPAYRESLPPTLCLLQGLCLLFPVSGALPLAPHQDRAFLTPQVSTQTVSH